MAVRGLVVGLAALASLSNPAAAMAKEVYTSNPVCRKRYCINPVFPGLSDLNQLQAVNWQCSTHNSVKSYLDFCSEHVSYDPALPSPAAGLNSTVMALVQKQEEAATTTFFYHVSAMGYEPWEFEDASLYKNDCIKAVQRMTCFTYFPRSQASCSEGAATPYLKPCASCCHNYMKQCGVECCDESAQCVFEHTSIPPGQTTALVTTGYASQLGPSALCTGAGNRVGPQKVILWGLLLLQAAVGSFANPLSLVRGAQAPLVALLVAVAVSLQGCSFDIPMHSVGNWRSEDDYLTSYEYIPPGQSALNATINSCAVQNSSALTQCSGHGFCETWTKATSQDEQAISFCKCDRDWTDPECKTRRKSQTVAFLYSMFLGFLGADQFYMGFPIYGTLKLMTIGGCGFWYLYDMIRIGATPVYTAYHKLAHDLSHWMFVTSFMSFCCFVGFAIAIVSTVRARNTKRREVMHERMVQEAASWNAVKSGKAAGYGSWMVGGQAVKSAAVPFAQL